MTGTIFHRIMAVRGSATTTKGVLLTIEGRTPGEALNCAVIPLDRVGVVIESLKLAAEQARRS